jgi:hypothetical protein
LRVRFEGSGNAKLIELPSLNLPTTVEVYDTKTDAKYFKNGKSYKEFEVLLIPRQEGELSIPALSFSVFDPQKKQYVTQTTEPIPLKIIPSSQSPMAQGSGLVQGAGGAAPAAKVEKKNLLPDILVSWQASRSLTGTMQIVWWAALYAFIFGILGWKTRNELGWGQKQRDLRSELQKRHRKIAQMIEHGEWRKAGSEMTNSIYFVLGSVSGQRGASQELSKLLDQSPPSLRRELGPELSRLTEICQVLSFAPEGVVGRLKEPAELKKAFQDVEKVLLEALKLAENRTQD